MSPKHWILSTTLTAITCLQALNGATVKGIVLPNQDVTLSSVTENTITAIEVKEGDNLSKGALLAVFDDRIRKLEVARGEKSLQLLETANTSSQNLVKENIISREEALQSEIERDMAKIELEAARTRLEDTRLRAPLDGILVESYKEPGEMIRPGEEIFRIINIDTVFVQMFLPWEDALKLSEGETLEIKFPGISENAQYAGDIDFIDPAIDPTSGFQRIRIKLDNPDHIIRSGMRGEVILP